MWALVLTINILLANGSTKTEVITFGGYASASACTSSAQSWAQSRSTYSDVKLTAKCLREA